MSPSTARFSLLMIAMALAFGLWGLAVLPEAERYAVHWDMQGNANRFEDKAGVALAFFGLPMVMAVMHALFWGVSRIESEREKLEQMGGIFNAIIILTQGVSLIIAVFTVDTIVAGQLDVNGMNRFLRLITVLSILPIVAIGNIIAKRHRGRLLPINLPTPLTTEASQGRFLRATGRAMVAIGLVAFAVTLWKPLAGLVALSALGLLLPLGLIPYGRKLAAEERASG